MSDPIIPGWPFPESPFHEGSLAIQHRLGVAERLDQVGRRAILNVMTEQHRTFFPQLPFLLVGSVDGEGQPWASILVGWPGFATPSSETTLQVAARPLFGDPLGANLAVGAELGVLGIELPTRRRNRLNGRVASRTEGGFAVTVAQALGNCPKYIQRREHHFVSDAWACPQSSPVHRGQCLDGAARTLIATADTFFVATVFRGRADHPGHHGVDISHRGGRPGFVRIDDDHLLTTPDFVGNFHFRTLGNLQLEPRAGLLFIDFRSGDLLYLAAEAEVIWDSELVREFAGAERLVRYRIRQTIFIKGSLPLRFSEPDYSPFLK